jgi:hypothetical protein
MLNVFDIVIGSTLSHRKKAKMFWMSHFTDEAWIHLSGFVNLQNSGLWSSENPHAFLESPLHAQKIGVWIGISRW